MLLLSIYMALLALAFYTWAQQEFFAPGMLLWVPFRAHSCNQVHKRSRRQCKNNNTNNKINRSSSLFTFDTNFHDLVASTPTSSVILHFSFYRFLNLKNKGELAWESHTGTQLVSPAASGKKKIDPCRTGAHNLKIGTLEHHTVSIDDPWCSTTWMNNCNMGSLRPFKLALSQSTCSGVIWPCVFLALDILTQYYGPAYTSRFEVVRRWHDMHTSWTAAAAYVHGGMHGLVSQVLY